jgi:hypothetical protein
LVHINTLGECHERTDEEPKNLSEISCYRNSLMTDQQGSKENQWTTNMAPTMALATLVGLAGLPLTLAADKPHVLMLLADDFGWANAGGCLPLFLSHTPSHKCSRVVRVRMCCVCGPCVVATNKAWRRARAHREHGSGDTHFSDVHISPHYLGVCKQFVPFTLPFGQIM